MKNKDKYNFSDFTFDEYEFLISIAKEHYLFRNFDNFEKGERFIIWRHDIDFSMISALELAELDAKNGIQSTFFLLPHSEFYNLLEKESKVIVDRIKELGHQIGLHFDSHYYGVNSENQLDELIRRETAFFESLFDIKISCFSFHNTTDFTMSCTNWTYGGLINTYADYFRNEVGYCSDSNGYWRHDRMKDVLKKAEDYCIQILTHDCWWQKKIQSPKQKVHEMIESAAQSKKDYYTNLLTINGRTIIDWED
jgi:hypothetical protein